MLKHFTEKNLRRQPRDIRQLAGGNVGVKFAPEDDVAAFLERLDMVEVIEARISVTGPGQPGLGQALRQRIKSTRWLRLKGATGGRIVDDRRVSRDKH